MPKRAPKPAVKSEKTRSARKNRVPARIEASMPVTTILALLPESESLLAEYGLHCFHCAGASTETLAEGCRSHGWREETIDNLVDDLNTLLAERPVLPQMLTVTVSAARALKDVMQQEGKPSAMLLVTVDEGGGFCMEFEDTAPVDARIFTNSDEPSVQVAASALTLGRIGGATIDFRDGRFKLDLPEAARAPCACAAGTCECGRK